MSKQRHQGSQDELPLFDFPLGAEGEPGELDTPVDAPADPPDDLGPRRVAKRRESAPNLHLVPKPSAASAPTPSVPTPPAETDDRHPPLARRLASGLVDLGAHAVVLAIAFLGVRLLGVQPSAASVAPFAIFALVFSFLYCVVPLAFWGRTPGMVMSREIARSLDDQPLSFGQTILRWLGALVTLALAGLPTLLAFVGGRSLADQISGSKTVAV